MSSISGGYLAGILRSLLLDALLYDRSICRIIGASFTLFNNAIVHRGNLLRVHIILLKDGFLNSVLN